MGPYSPFEDQHLEGCTSAKSPSKSKNSPNADGYWEALIFRLSGRKSSKNCGVGVYSRPARMA